jgi:pyruvate formate lyase activating enzyme
MEYTDLLLLDIKEMNDERHKVITGKSNVNVLDMATYLSEINKPVWIRHVLVPERSDYDEDLLALRDFIKLLHNVERVEVLPYHTLGVYKWKELGLDYALEDIDPPKAERIANANEILNTQSYLK